MKSLHFMMLALGITVCFASVSYAQSDSLKILGPTEVSPGQLVRLQAQLDQGESPFWIVLNPVDLDYEQTDNGQRLIFAVGCNDPKPITILLLAQQVKEGRIVTRQIRRTLRVSRDPKPEDPGSEPDPAPAPTDWTKSPLYQPVRDALANIESSEARSRSDDVAQNFTKAADQCQSGAIQSRQEIWRSISQSNQQTLGDQSVHWESVGVVLQTGFQQLQLAEVEDHIFHLRAVAAALRSSNDE